MAIYDSTTPSPAIPVSWVEDPLVCDISFIKKSHLIELRAVLTALDGHTHVFNSVTSGAELPDVTVTWAESNASIVVDTTFIKASHMQELIDYLKDFDAHYHSVGLPNGPYNSTTYDPTLTFQDDPIIADVTFIKEKAWSELRTYSEGYASHIHSVNCSCECTCTCTCTCQCQCQTAECCCSECWAFD